MLDYNTDWLIYLMGQKKHQSIDFQFKNLPFNKGNYKVELFLYPRLDQRQSRKQHF